METKLYSDTDDRGTVNKTEGKQGGQPSDGPGQRNYREWTALCSRGFTSQLTISGAVSSFTNFLDVNMKVFSLRIPEAALSPLRGIHLEEGKSGTSELDPSRPDKATFSQVGICIGLKFCIFFLMTKLNHLTFRVHSIATTACLR